MKKTILTTFATITLFGASLLPTEAATIEKGFYDVHGYETISLNHLNMPSQFSYIHTLLDGKELPTPFLIQAFIPSLDLDNTPLLANVPQIITVGKETNTTVVAKQPTTVKNNTTVPQDNTLANGNVETEKNETTPEAKPETKPEAKPETKPDVKPTPPATKPEPAPTPNPEPTPPTKPETEKPPVSNASFESEVLRLTNAERTKAGLAPLQLDSAISNVARIKSKDMADNGYFSHTSPTYGSPFDMLSQFGISYSSAAENIAKGQATPQQVVTDWMNSSGHRANILNGAYTHIGIGYVSNGHVWTQMFVGR